MPACSTKRTSDCRYQVKGKPRRLFVKDSIKPLHEFKSVALAKAKVLIMHLNYFAYRNQSTLLAVKYMTKLQRTRQHLSVSTLPHILWGFFAHPYLAF